VRLECVPPVVPLLAERNPDYLLEVRHGARGGGTAAFQLALGLLGWPAGSPAKSEAAHGTRAPGCGGARGCAIVPRHMNHLACLLLAVSLTGIPAAANAAAQAAPAAPPTTMPVPAPRPAHWAEPIELEGVPNLHRITPHLYRSEQPTALGMRNLEKLGIRTVINLRAFNDDEEEVRGTSLRTERLKILTWRVGDDHVVEVMRLLRATENGPFLIHCQHGADRTGLMSAMYRILEQDWTADEALKELTEGGYGHHSMWRNIRRYVRRADAVSLRARIAAGPQVPVARETASN
jgi:protein tyrosine phosphatase (PTP) superfamily phosphohydrolase (DUF442 family)